MIVIEKRKIYKPQSNTDLSEGRGLSIQLGVYLSEDKAKAKAKGRGVQGSNGDIWVSDSSVVIDSESGKMHLLGDEVQT